MLQIPVMGHNEEGKLLGVRFRNGIDEEQFMLAVSEKIDGFNLPYTMKPDLGGVPSYNSRPKPGYIKPTLPNLTAPQQYIPGDVPYPGGMQQPNQQRDPNPHIVNLPQEKEYVPPKLPPHRQRATTMNNPPNQFVVKQDFRRFGDSGAYPNARMDHPQGQRKEDNFDTNGQRRYQDELRHQRQQQPYQQEQQQQYQQQQFQQQQFQQQNYPQQHYNDQQNQPYKQQQPPYPHSPNLSLIHISEPTRPY